MLLKLQSGLEHGFIPSTKFCRWIHNIAELIHLIIIILIIIIGCLLFLHLVDLYIVTLIYLIISGVTIKYKGGFKCCIFFLCTVNLIEVRQRNTY